MRPALGLVGERHPGSDGEVAFIINPEGSFQKDHAAATAGLI